MKNDDSQADNLFSRLLSYASREEGHTQKENFCTESLAWCLRTSSEFRIKFMNLVRERIIKIKPEKQLSFPADISKSPLEVQTQFGFSEKAKRGFFDLVIHSTSFDEFALVVEVKVDSDFENTQISRYRSELNSRRSFRNPQKAFLVSLTKPRGIPDELKSDLDACLFWPEIHRLLEAASDIDEKAGGNVYDLHATIFIQNQFAEFLKSQGMYHMRIPKSSNQQSFIDGVQFCDSIHQILLQVRARSNDVQNICDSNVHREEESGGKNVSLVLRNKGSREYFRAGFQMLPNYEMFVQCSSSVCPTDPQQKDMNFYPWGNNGKVFGVTGDFADCDGDAEKIGDWFDRAVGLVLRLRKA
jgi:hypothetical protein